MSALYEQHKQQITQHHCTNIKIREALANSCGEWWRRARPSLLCRRWRDGNTIRSEITQLPLSSYPTAPLTVPWSPSTNSIAIWQLPVKSEAIDNDSWTIYCTASRRAGLAYLPLFAASTSTWMRPRCCLALVNQLDRINQVHKEADFQTFALCVYFTVICFMFAWLNRFG